MESKYGLEDFSVKDLIAVLTKRGGGRRPNTAGLERAELVRMAREAGAENAFLGAIFVSMLM